MLVYVSLKGEGDWLCNKKKSKMQRYLRSKMRQKSQGIKLVLNSRRMGRTIVTKLEEIIRAIDVITSHTRGVQLKLEMESDPCLAVPVVTSMRPYLM